MDDDRPRLDQLNIVVSNMAASVDFYRRLGVTVPDVAPEWADWDAHHRNVDLPGDARIDLDSVAFASQWDTGWRGSPGCVIGFRVQARETVDQIYADLTGAGYRGQQAPFDAFWGARYAVVEDPDSNAVGIMSEIDPARRTPTPPPPSTL